MKKLLIIGTVAMLLVPLVVFANTYQFIISGDSESVATIGSCAVASSGTSLVTSTFTTPAVAASLEVRYLTWDESDGIALRSDKFSGMTIYIK